MIYDDINYIMMTMINNMIISTNHNNYRKNIINNYDIKTVKKILKF